MLRHRLALIAALLLAAPCTPLAPLAPAGAAVEPGPPQAVLVGSYDWSDSFPGFGGYSGLDLAPDGSRFAALSDRGHVVEGRLLRDAQGAITAVEAGPPWRLLTTGGIWRDGPFNDSEGLAIAPQGGFYVSYEGYNPHVAYVPGRGQPARPLPVAPGFATLPLNAALEALATGPDGALYTLPEAPPAGRAAFPVWRFRDGRWQQPFSIPARGPYRSTGADIGPDGRLYLLERHFSLLGFSSRVRRFDLGPEGISGEVTLLETSRGLHGNLEGLAVWRDGGGAIRLTMVSDNNQLWLVQTQLVDYRVEPD